MLKWIIRMDQSFLYTEKQKWPYTLLNNEIHFWTCNHNHYTIQAKDLYRHLYSSNINVIFD